MFVRVKETFLWMKCRFVVIDTVGFRKYTASQRRIYKAADPADKHMGQVCS
jgi:hypothetical protein